MRILYIVIFTLVCLVSLSQSARILGVFPVISHSHYVLGHRLFKALALGGHEVVFVSPYKDKAPVKNFKDVILTGFLEKQQEMEKTINLFDYANMNAVMKLFFMYGMGLMTTELTLEHPEFQKIIKSNETFDLVVVEPFITDAVRILGHHFKAPTLLLSSFGSSSVSNFLVANPAPLSYVPDFIIDHSGPMNFCVRLENAFMDVVHQLLRYWYVEPKHNALLQKHFPGAPSISEFKSSLILLNSHPAITAAAPHVPKMVEVGGFHVDPPGKLPIELQQFLDSAKEGVIYFSLGSIAKSKNLSPEQRNIFINVFRKLKVKVLWKFEEESLADKPDNVMIYKWIPQQDVLAHPNVKFFISHGGLLSTIEAIHHGKATLGIPVFAEQKMNVQNSVLAGFSLMVPFQELSEEKLYSAIQEMLSNPSYGITAQKRSKILHDQPMKPLDQAVFWTEFVLKHGTDHLDSYALELNWFQRNLVDVIAAFMLAIFGSIFAIIFICKLICCKRKNDKIADKVSKKKKL